MTKKKCDLLSKPYFIIENEASRGAKHGMSEEQYDHCKAVDSLQNAKRKGVQVDVRSFFFFLRLLRESRRQMGQLALEDKSYTAIRRERTRYENNWRSSVSADSTKAVRRTCCRRVENNGIGKLCQVLHLLLHRQLGALPLLTHHLGGPHQSGRNASSFFAFRKWRFPCERREV